MEEKVKKSFGRRLLKIVGIVLTVIVLALSSIFVIHRVSLQREASKIKAYGELYDVFDGQMNVQIEGKGPETIVLLPGFGTASPVLDFKPLIDELKDEYRVVAIEPFGYGLSTGTERERSVENMVAEIHEVVSQLNLKSYILMGHSITGIYGINYIAAYPDEVKGFAGVDTSAPAQPWPGVNDGFLTFIQKSGLLRAIMKVEPNRKTDEVSEQMRLITMKNSGNDTLRRELASLTDSFSESKGMTFPKDLPVILFVAENETNMPHWLEYHEDQVANLTNAKLFSLPGTHYLHHTQSKKIAEEVKAFFPTN